VASSSSTYWHLLHFLYVQAVQHSVNVTPAFIRRGRPGKMLDDVATALLQTTPPESVIFADTHTRNRGRWGSRAYMGVLYNPYRNTVNVHLMADMKDDQAMLKQEWIENPWYLMTTPLHDADDRHTSAD
jgi:hypothetical protein